MNDGQFEKIHAAFVKCYNIDDDVYLSCAYNPAQRPFINLRKKVREILDA